MTAPIINIEDLKRVIKELLSPKEYEDYEERLSKDEEEPCLIRDYFAHEAEKPAHLRKDYCHIYCPCSRCKVGTL